MSDESNTATLEAPATPAKPKASKPKAKAAKKATKVKAKKASKSKPQMDPKERKERDEAKAANLSLVHYRILRALANGNPASYRDIEKRTGYYSILTAQLRKEHEGSLGANGMVREEVHDVDGRDVLQFTITAKGRKAIGK